MATEYDLLHSFLSRSERHNQQPRGRFDKHIRTRKLLLSLLTPGRGMRHHLSDWAAISRDKHPMS